MDARKLANDADTADVRALGHTLASNHAFPLDLMFLKANGRFINKLNSLADFKRSQLSNQEVFMSHVKKLTGRD